MSIPLPVEPLYSLESAAAMVPTTLSRLKDWLRRHKAEVSPAQYVWNHGSRRRLLPASDIVLMRSRLVSTVQWPETARKRRLREQREQEQQQGDPAA